MIHYTKDKEKVLTFGQDDNANDVRIQTTAGGDLRIEQVLPVLEEMNVQLKRLVFMMHVAFDMPYEGAEDEV